MFPIYKKKEGASVFLAPSKPLRRLALGLRAVDQESERFGALVSVAVVMIDFQPQRNGFLFGANYPSGLEIARKVIKLAANRSRQDKVGRDCGGIGFYKVQ